MKSFNFIITDLVRNNAGDLLAVSVDGWDYKTYHYTKDENRVDEDREDTFLFKRKSDIKKVRASKNKNALIDKMNLEILKNNVGVMAFCLEQASERLLCHVEKQGLQISGPDGFSDLPDNMAYIAKAGRLINKGLDNYSNYLKLCMENGVGLYSLSINRTNNFKDDEK